MKFFIFFLCPCSAGSDNRLMSSAVTYLSGKEPHSREKRLIFRNIDREGYDPSIECYLKDGGYDQLKKALKMERSAITNEVKATGTLARQLNLTQICQRVWGT